MVSPARVLVYVSVAGNIDPEQHLPAALEDLHAAARIRAVSTFYRTPALGRPEQPDYLNGVVAVETALPPRALKFGLLRGIEAAHGRVRTADTWAARTVDLDILVYGAELIEEEGLRLPDPDLGARAFLAVALEELAPGITPPGWPRPLSESIDGAEAEALVSVSAFTAYLRERFLT